MDTDSRSPTEPNWNTLKEIHSETPYKQSVKNQKQRILKVASDNATCHMQGNYYNTITGFLSRNRLRQKAVG